jgi:uncharacterized damage-inducible protein DinB
MTTTSDLRYPVGRFTPESGLSDARRAEFVDEIAQLPARLRAAVAGLDERQLGTPYRPGGWTVRQLVHHVADSHLNAYIRFKLGLTEDAPPVKPYDEALWADLPDVAVVPIETSLRLLDALHERWTALLRALTPEQLARIVHHPEHPQPMSLERLLDLYAWHSRHHVAHVTALREREGW